jgi:hypothetical protein
MKFIFKFLLLLLSLPAISQSTITVPSSGTVATENWVKEYLFTQLEKVANSDCDLKAVDIVKQSNYLEFALTGAIDGLNTYSVRITKGTQVWYWNNVPYQTGSRMRLEGVPAVDSVRVTIRPTLRPTCYYAFGYNLSGGGGPGPDPDPDPVVTTCPAGPLIQSIYNIATTGITSQFHGNGVTLLTWKIIDSSNQTIRTGQIAPSSPILNIGFSSPIAAGDYKLRLDGVNCTGFSEKTFTLSGGGGGTDPPIPSGTIVPKVVVKGLAEHMDIVVSGTGTSKTLTDNADFTPPSGYEFRYWINDQVVKQSTRLVNFPWPSNVPVMIYKMQIKPSIGDITIWGYKEGWQDPTAGAVFSHNTTCAFTQIVFDDENSGYNPTKQTVQWMDYLPDMPATDNGIWVAPKGSLNTIAQLVAKGVTTFSNYAISDLPSSEENALINAGKTYNEAVKTPQQLILPDRGAGQWVPIGLVWPNVWHTQFFDYVNGQAEPLTYQQGFDKGNQYTVAHRITIFENSENVHAISDHWSFWKPYYENLTSRAQARFPGLWRIAHNYFTGAVANYPEGVPSFNDKINAYGLRPGNLGDNSRTQAKAFLTAPLSDWPSSQMSPGGNLETVNSACYGIYSGSVDQTRHNPYRMMYMGHLTHKAGKYLFAFMQEVYEWHPNNYVEVRYPTGKFYLMDKMAHSQAQLYNIALISRVFLDGFIPFGAKPKTGENYNFQREYVQGMWYPNGATTPQDPNSFPYWTPPGGGPVYPTDGFEDGIARGMYAYYQTFMQTHGGTKQFLRYRLNGGNWVEAQNNNLFDVIDAFYDQRAIVYSEVKNGKLAVMYLNPYADGSIKTLEYQYNGVTYSMQVASIQAHVKLHTL